MAFDFTVVNFSILALQHPPLQELILVILITISEKEDLLEKSLTDKKEQVVKVVSDVDANSTIFMIQLSSTNNIVLHI